jgi:molybdopterin-guanine dinucleotide biosynthesis protein
MGRPITIGVGGAYSGIGKTTFAAALLRNMTAPKQRSPHETVRSPLYSLKTWGAIKYTRTAIHCSVTDDAQVLRHTGKDTAIMFNAGAAEVMWIQAPPEELAEVMPMVMERLSGLDGIIVEGNSAIEFLKPDIVIFLTASSRERFKPSADKILELADILVLPTGLADASRSGSGQGETSARRVEGISINPLIEKEVDDLLDIMNKITAGKGLLTGRS